MVGTSATLSPSPRHAWSVWRKSETVLTVRMTVGTAGVKLRCAVQHSPFALATRRRVHRQGPGARC